MYFFSPWRVRCALLFWVLWPGCGLWAQQVAPVRGTVQDSAGAPVEGAAITLAPATPGTERQAVSSSSGQFQFDAVAPGDYVLSVAPTKGLAGQQMPVHAKRSMAALKVVLAPATVSETVNVNTDTTLSTDAEANQDAVTLSANMLQHLPVFDQDYVNTLSSFLDPAATSTSGVSIMVDGVEMKGSTVTPSAIAEVRLNTDPYSAEFPNPGRGRLEIITKPGSPQFHGQLNFIARDAVFNARNYFAPVRPPEQRRIYEGNVTGPVGHGGNTTFLISGARREQDIEAAVHAATSQGLVAVNVPTPNRNTQLTGRVTHDFSPTHRLAVAYNFEYATYVNRGVGGVVLAEAGYNTDSREDDLIFNDRLILSPTLIHQLQINFEKDEDVTRSVTDAPSIQVQSAFTGGGAQADLNRTENTVHIREVVSWTHKNHYLRFGAIIPQISKRAVDDHTNRLGTFAFNSLTDYNNARPYVFTVQQGIGRGLYWINEPGAFVQDEIAVRKDLHVTLGVRYQWQTYLSDRDNFAPRLSFAYAPGKKWVVRGGSGLFYDRTGGDYPATFKLHNGIVLQQFQVINPGYPSPLPPGQSFAGVPTSLVREDARLRAPYTLQYSVDAERAITPQLTATVGYRGITGVDSFRSRDANAPLPPGYNTVPNPGLGFVQQIESGARSRTHAMDISLHGKIGVWFEGQAQYTLSRTYTNTGGINWYPQNQYQPNAEWGRADFDRLQRFNLIGTIHPDHWLSLGVATTLASGTPYTELAGSDFYNTGLGNARPAGVGRNTLQGGGIEDVDLQWDHDFHLNKAKGDSAKLLNVGISAFDVFNHPNFTNYIGNIRSPLFGQPTTALAGRQMQFALRYQF